MDSGFMRNPLTSSQLEYVRFVRSSQPQQSAVETWCELDSNA
jgi:hypothetical protein